MLCYNQIDVSEGADVNNIIINNNKCIIIYNNYL